MNNERNKMIEPTEAQFSPGLARPEDFEVSTPDQIARTVPGHGQRGKDKKEYNRLLQEAFAEPGKSVWQGRGQELTRPAGE
jgi:hypothetical protein